MSWHELPALLQFLLLIAVLWLASRLWQELWRPVDIWLTERDARRWRARMWQHEPNSPDWKLCHNNMRAQERRAQRLRSGW